MTLQTCRPARQRRVPRHASSMRRCVNLPLLVFLISLTTPDLIAARLLARAKGSAPEDASYAPLQLHYAIRIARPTTHLAEIEIDARGVSAPALDFVLPAWSPGRYAIYDFAKNVQEFEARTSGARDLAWSQTDKQTWHVETGATSEVRVRYKVYGNDLNGSFSQIDSSHANLNGASIFMYVAGHKPDPVHLTLEAPEVWKAASGYSLDVHQRSFRSEERRVGKEC